MRKSDITRLVAFLLLLTSIGLWSSGAMALLRSRTDPVTNSFTTRTPEPGIVIVEELDSGKKVSIKNTGEVPIYVEVYLSVCYRSDTTTTDVLPADFTYVKGDSGWQWSGNYAYWPNELQPNATTPPLITDVTAPAAPEGYHLEVRVIAQKKQSTN